MLILPNKNTMIIIKLSSKIKHITENQYKKIIQSLNFDELAKKQLEKIIINFRSSPVAEMSPFANTLTNWKKEIINSFIIVDDKLNRKMNTAIVENRNRSIKLLKHASNGYLKWERFRNRILYTLNEDTTFYYTSIRKDGK